MEPQVHPVSVQHIFRPRRHKHITTRRSYLWAGDVLLLFVFLRADAHIRAPHSGS